MSTAIIAQPSGPAAGFGLLMSPQTITEVQTFCKMLAATDFVPKAFRAKPDSIMVVGAMGARLGVDVFSAMAGIADINGKPSVYGDLMLAVCMNHPQFEDCIETHEGTPYEDTFRAVCTVKRKGRAPVVRSFSVLEAKEAGLWKKEGPWSKTPQRMLSMRARAFALRDTFADGLAGFHSVEEFEGEPRDVTASATIHDDPKEGKTRKTRADKEPAAIEAKAETKPDAQSGTVIHEGKDSVITAGVQLADGTIVADTSPAAPVARSIADCKAKGMELWKTEDGKKLFKDHLATWKIGKVDELGEQPPEEIARFYDRLVEIVAIHIQLHGALK